MSTIINTKHRNSFDVVKTLCFAVLIVASSASTEAQLIPGLGSRSVTLPAPVPMRTRTFAIPFEARPDTSADPAKEVELLYSKDGGVRWHSYGKASLEKKKFDFQAESDGEYWFVFRTITLSGQTRGATGTPQIRALVDTTPPEIVVEMRQQPSGDMLVHWKATDANFQGKRPEFAVTPVAPLDPVKNWTPLSIDNRNLRIFDGGLEGSFLFRPDRLGPSDSDAYQIELGAVIEDMAGNRTQKTIRGAFNPSTNSSTNPLVGSYPSAPDSKVAAVPQQTKPTGQQTELARSHYNGSNNGPMPLTPPKPIRVRRDSVKNSAKNSVTSTEVAVSTTDKNTFENKTRVNPQLQSKSAGAALALDSIKETPAEEKTPDPMALEIFNKMQGLFGEQGISMPQIVPGTKHDVKETVSNKPKNEKRNIQQNIQRKSLAAGPTLSGPIQASSLPEPIRPLPADTNPKIASNRNEDPATSTTPTPPPTRAEEPVQKPGRITDVSLNSIGAQSQIIVKWNIGPVPWNRGQIDILRAETDQGPWQPISTNLSNNGEYWWFLTPDDLKPFYLMVRLRGPQGALLDTTRSPIQVPAELLRRK